MFAHPCCCLCTFWIETLPSLYFNLQTKTFSMVKWVCAFWRALIGQYHIFKYKKRDLRSRGIILAWTILNSDFLRISRHKQGRRPKDNQFLWGKSILWLSLHHHNCSLVCYVLVVGILNGFIAAPCLHRTSTLACVWNSDNFSWPSSPLGTQKLQWKMKAYL